MTETCNKAGELLNSVFEGAGFDLKATPESSESGCFLDITGRDTSLLLNEGGELLDALQHLLNQALGRTLEKDERIVCDVEGFRAGREAELRAMAVHAAQRVRTTSTPFDFGPMQASERRIIHVSLASEGDLQTESIGEGNARRLRVSLKSSP
ncbi:MAG: R3H domain-containing nucleic acid-binding protein [Pyrinomonadaceae bacterium]